MGTRAVVVGAAVAAAAAAIMTQAANLLIKPWEGLALKPYYDVGHVKTVCYGATASEQVNLNRTYTKDECGRILVAGLPKYYYGMISCIKSNKPIPISMQIAFTSTTFNIGIKGFCGSSMARLASAGDYKGACGALHMWNRAGGKVWPGLDNRRRAEYKLCMRDL